MRRERAVNEQAGRFILGDLNQFGIEIVRGGRAGADKIGQPIISITHE